MIFSLNLIKPEPNTLQVKWFLNNVPYDINTNAVVIESSELQAGSNTLSVTVEDTSALLRVDEHNQTHMYNVTWSIEATDAQTYPLNISIEGNGSTSPSSGLFAENSSVSITATPDPGYIFSGWSGDYTGTENPMSIIVDSEKSLRATFIPIPSETLVYNISMPPTADYNTISVELNTSAISAILNLTVKELTSGFEANVSYSALNPDGTLNTVSTANAPGHWFGLDGTVVAWGNNSYIFSELDTETLTANIGQYPDRVNAGDSFTIMQVLASATGQVIIEYNITIEDVITEQTIELNKGWNIISLNRHPADSSIPTLFSGLNVSQIKTMNTYWSKQLPAYFNTLSHLTAGKGYLVFMETAGTLTVSGEPMVETAHGLSLLGTWELMGVPYQNNTLITDVFNGTAVQTIKNFDGFWQADGSGTLLNLEPGKGYFVK